MIQTCIKCGREDKWSEEELLGHVKLPIYLCKGCLDLTKKLIGMKINGSI